MGNRQQRRSKKHRDVGRLPGESLAEAMQRKKKTMEAYEKAANDETLDVKAEIRTQRALWMCCVAMNRAFGIGPSRFQQFAGELDKVLAWYEDNKKKGRGDDVYANEMLRREASRCAGMEVNSLYDEEMMEAVAELNRAKTQGDRFRAMTDEGLAEWIFHAWQASIETGAPFHDLSLAWCHGEESCEGTVCTDEKVLGCILKWLQSPAGQEAAHGT